MLDENKGPLSVIVIAVIFVAKDLVTALALTVPPVDVIPLFITISLLISRVIVNVPRRGSPEFESTTAGDSTSEPLSENSIT
jgi:hypothetical protein